MIKHRYPMVDNYIYLYHIDQFIVVPAFPDSLNDQYTVNYNKSTPLARSAPIYSFSDSGPRSLQINLELHRDMMNEVNWPVSNAKIATGDDYVDTLIKGVQAAALPSYGLSEKMVDPPMVAVRFGNEVFIKGVVVGGVGVTYQLPLLSNGKYANVSVNFTVEEIDPYDAQTTFTVGSFRGIDPILEKNFWKA